MTAVELMNGCKVKRENQQDATNSMFIIKLSISTCFGHNDAQNMLR